jgi:hypothetical protein
MFAVASPILVFDVMGVRDVTTGGAAHVSLEKEPFIPFAVGVMSTRADSKYEQRQYDA